jgi:uncharacterized membrane protein (DUF485 family)
MAQYRVAGNADKNINRDEGGGMNRKGQSGFLAIGFVIGVILVIGFILSAVFSSMEAKQFNKFSKTQIT